MKTSKRAHSKTIKSVYAAAYFIFSILLLSSCKKEVSYPELTRTGINLENFTPGSWWKYEWTKTDGTTGEVTPMDSHDSVYVKGDTVINGNTYLHLTGTYFLGMEFDRILRDSLEYIVDKSGAILFSARPEPDTIKVAPVEEFTVHTILSRETGSVTVPAGTFSDMYQRQNHYYLTDGSTWACGTHWVSIQYFKDGVGIVYERSALFSQLYANCTYMERKLAEYHISQ